MNYKITLDDTVIPLQTIKLPKDTYAQCGACALSEAFSCGFYEFYDDGHSVSYECNLPAGTVFTVVLEHISTVRDMRNNVSVTVTKES